MKAALVVVAFAMLLLTSAISAADPLRVEVNAVDEKPGLISVVLTAIDGSGKPLTDLNAGNFKATLNGVDVPISSIDAPGASAKVTTGIVLLVDVSGSMYGDSIVQARAALQEFVNNLDPSDQVAVLAFSDGVTQLQDFTSNRSQLNTAITKLTAFGDTALYDAVTEATRKAGTSTATRKMVVVLSDGVSTINNGQREASIEVARTSGVSIIPVGLGSEIDREYLQTIADVSGGRVVEASTAASLSQSYTNLAASIRSRYSVHVTVPATVDRTLPAVLKLTLNSSSGSTVIERNLDPLAGATAPAFSLTAEGLKPNQDLAANQTIKPVVPAAITLAKVEYFVDGKSVHVASAAPFDYTLDGSVMDSGAHLVKLVATDTRGATAQTDVAFRVPAPAKSSPIGTILPILAVLLLLGGLGFGGYRIVSRRLAMREADGTADNVVRIRPFAVKSNDEMAPPQDWPERRPVAPRPVSQLLGRIVVMDEDAIRQGDLTAIREYAIGSAPLTLGAGENCDIQILDEDNIAMEEARLWIQKGRLVYHKLTTLSAMATEGVTSGWLLLASGEELLLGKYRLLYQAEVPVSVPDDDSNDELPEPNKQFMGWSV